MQPHPRYELLEKLASGSFATVYRGRDVELGREVAIKQIHQQFLEDPQQLDRYWKEAQLLASLQHPNIVTIYDVVRERGWLILELMQSDLSKVAGRKQMDLNALRTTLAHCLRALKFLHSHGIVHGDVKPSNMMIDRRRRVKVGDFGLARRVSDEEGSLIKGTTKYMAPEVVSDEFGEVGPSSDLYSLGFAAYELMCGENFESLFPGLSAFGRDRQMAWMMWHAAPDRRLPEIRRVLDNVPDDLARTIQKLVAKPQAERYHSADEALSDLNIDIKLVKTGEESSLGLSRSIPGVADPARKKRLMAIVAVAASLVLSLVAILMPSGGGGTNGTTGPGDGTRPLSGVVRQVLAEEGKLVIEDEAGHPSKVSVGTNPHIRLDGGQYIMLEELQPRDRVEIRFDESGRNKPPEIAALRPAESTGKVKSVDPGKSLLMVTIAADPHPQDVPMFAPQGAQLSLNGQPATLAELAPGDRVDVLHLKDTHARAARDVIRLDARRTMKLRGFVHEIKEQNDKQWLVIDRHGERQAIEFRPKCEVRINGSADEAGRPLAPADLKPGDRISVTHDSHVTAVDATRRDRVTGSVLKIDQAAHTVLVRASTGDEVTFDVGDKCDISIDEAPAELADLRKYDRIEVTFDSREGGPGAARTIDARRPKDPK